MQDMLVCYIIYASLYITFTLYVSRAKCVCKNGHAGKSSTPSAALR